MISLERLADGSVTARNFDKLAALVLDTGGVTAGVRFGTVTLTFTASVESGVATVTHGFTSAPLFVVVANTMVVGSRELTGFAEAPGATTFRAFARSSSSFTGTSVHPWLAIG